MLGRQEPENKGDVAVLAPKYQVLGTSELGGRCVLGGHLGKQEN